MEEETHLTSLGNERQLPEPLLNTANRLGCTRNAAAFIVEALGVHRWGISMSRVMGAGTIAAVLLATATIIATMQGWVNDSARTLLLQLWSILAAFVAAYYDIFDRIGKVLAPFVAVLSGGYAIYQKWHFAGRNMHLRLQEFLAREETRLRHADQELNLAAVRPSPAFPFQSPIFPPLSLPATLRKMQWGTPTLFTLHWNRLRRADQEVERAAKQLQEQIDLWEKRKGDYQRRLIQAHLVKGAIAATRAAAIKERGGDDREENQNALTEFERALNVDPDRPDPLALELVAHQRVRLGDHSGAIDNFAQLAQWAESADKPVIRSRALKFQADIHEWRNADQPNVHEATRLLNTAIQIFPTPLARADIIEFAGLHEIQGRIRAKRVDFAWDGAALTSLTNAEGLYLRINGPEATMGQRRIADERKKILARRNLAPTAGNGSSLPS